MNCVVLNCLRLSESVARRRGPSSPATSPRRSFRDALPAPFGARRSWRLGPAALHHLPTRHASSCGAITMQRPEHSNLCQAARDLVRPPLPQLNRWIPSILLPAAPWLNIMRREPLPPLLEPAVELPEEEEAPPGQRRVLEPQARPQLLASARRPSPRPRRRNPAAPRVGGAAAARAAAAVAAANAAAIRLGMQPVGGAAAAAGGHVEEEEAVGQGYGDAIRYRRRVSQGARLLERLMHTLGRPRPTFCPRAASARWPSRKITQRERNAVRIGGRPVSVPANYRQRSRLASARRNASARWRAGEAGIGGERRVRIRRSMSSHLGWLTSGAVSLWRGFDQSVRPRAKLRAVLRRLQRVVTGYITMLPNALTYAADHAADVPGFQLATLPLVPTRDHFVEPIAPQPPPPETPMSSSPHSTTPATTPPPGSLPGRRNLTRNEACRRDPRQSPPPWPPTPLVSSVAPTPSLRSLRTSAVARHGAAKKSKPNKERRRSKRGMQATGTRETDKIDERIQNVDAAASAVGDVREPPVETLRPPQRSRPLHHRNRRQASAGTVPGAAQRRSAHLSAFRTTSHRRSHRPTIAGQRLFLIQRHLVAMQERRERLRQKAITCLHQRRAFSAQPTFCPETLNLELFEEGKPTSALMRLLLAEVSHLRRPRKHVTHCITSPRARRAKKKSSHKRKIHPRPPKIVTTRETATSPLYSTRKCWGTCGSEFGKPLHFDYKTGREEWVHLRDRRTLLRNSASKALSDTFASGGKKRRRYRVGGNISHLPVSEDLSDNTIKITSSVEARQVDSVSQTKEREDRVESKSSSSMLSNVLSKMLNVLGAVLIVGTSKTELKDEIYGDKVAASECLMKQTGPLNGDKNETEVEGKVLYGSSSFPRVRKQKMSKEKCTGIECIPQNHSLPILTLPLTTSSLSKFVRNRNTRKNSVTAEMGPVQSVTIGEKIRNSTFELLNKRRLSVDSSSNDLLSNTPTLQSKSLNILSSLNKVRDQKVESRTQIVQRKRTEFLERNLAHEHSSKKRDITLNSIQSKHSRQLHREMPDYNCNVEKLPQQSNKVESKLSDVRAPLLGRNEYLRENNRIVCEEGESQDLTSTTKACKPQAQLNSQINNNKNEFTREEFFRSFVFLRSQGKRHEQPPSSQDVSLIFSNNSHENETTQELNGQLSPTYSESIYKFCDNTSGVIYSRDMEKIQQKYQRDTDFDDTTDFGYNTRNIWRSLSVSSTGLDSDTPQNEAVGPESPGVCNVSFKETYSVVRCGCKSPIIFKDLDTEEENASLTQSTMSDLREIQRDFNVRETRSYDCSPVSRNIDAPRSLSVLLSCLNTGLSDNRRERAGKPRRETDSHILYRRELPTFTPGNELPPGQRCRSPSKHERLRYANLLQGKSMDYVCCKIPDSENDQRQHCLETKTEAEISRSSATNVIRKSSHNNGVSKRKKKKEKKLSSLQRIKILKIGEDNIENVVPHRQGFSADEPITKQSTSNIYSRKLERKSKDTFQTNTEEKSTSSNSTCINPVRTKNFDSTTSTTCSSCSPFDVFASTKMLRTLLRRQRAKKQPLDFTQKREDSIISSRANSDTATCLRMSPEAFPQRSIPCFLVNPDTPPRLPSTPKELVTKKCSFRFPDPSACKSKNQSPESSIYPNSTLPSSVVRTPTASMVSSEDSKSRVQARNVHFGNSFSKHVVHQLPSNNGNEDGNDTNSDPRVLGYVPTESCFVPYIPLQEKCESARTDSAPANSYFTAEVAPDSLVSESNKSSSAFYEHYFSVSNEVQESVPQAETENVYVYSDTQGASGDLNLVYKTLRTEDRDNLPISKLKNQHNYFPTKLYDIPENDASCSSEVGSRPLSAPEGNATYSICSSSGEIGQTYTIQGYTEDTDVFGKQTDLSRDSSNLLVLTPVPSAILEELPDDTSSIYSNAEGEAMSVRKNPNSSERPVSASKVASFASPSMRDTYDYKSLVTCLDRHANLLHEIGESRGIGNLPDRPPAASFGDRKIDRKEYMQALRQHLQLVRAVSPRSPRETSADRPSMATLLLL